MATLNQDSINFTNIAADKIFGVEAKYSASMNDDGTGKFDTTLTGNELAKSINAVEIDWNGAKLGTTTINTTGQLLSYISEVA